MARVEATEPSKKSKSERALKWKVNCMPPSKSVIIIQKSMREMRVGLPVNCILAVVSLSGCWIFEKLIVQIGA